MNFIDRQSTHPDRRKIKNIASAEEFIADIMRTSEEGVSIAGTPINSTNLNKGNWRDDNSVSFEKRSDNNLPSAHTTKTQIITKSNGEIWFIPPTGGGNAKQIGEKGDDGNSVVYLNYNINTEIGALTAINFQYFSQTPKIGDLAFTKNNCLGIIYSLVASQVTVKTERYLLDLDSENPLNVITDDNLPTKLAHLDVITDSILTNRLLSKIYPIGAIFMSTANSSPQSFLGGKWISWGGGRVPVGIGYNGESTYNTVETTGGGENNVAEHNHTQEAHNHGAGTISGNTGLLASNVGIAQDQTRSGAFTLTGVANRKVVGASSNSYQAGSLSFSATPVINNKTAVNKSSGAPKGNMQPYITCYMWKRIS